MAAGQAATTIPRGAVSSGGDACHSAYAGLTEAQPALSGTNPFLLVD
jgi:hypothetical protein